MQQLGPMLPPPQEPAAKRLRVDGGLLPLPPPPPGLPGYPSRPPPGMPPIQGSLTGIPPPPPPLPYGMHGQVMPPLPAAGMPPPGLPGLPPPGLPPPLGMPAPVMHPSGMPPQPFDPMAARDEDESDLLSEEEFAASLESPIVTLEISIPHDPSSQEWNFLGQTVSLSVNVMAKVKEIKEELSGSLNKISVTKLQLKHSQHGFLKDTISLAQLNLGPLVSLEMVPKTRGRRK
jgi:hypothetical protein